VTSRLLAATIVTVILVPAGFSVWAAPRLRAQSSAAQAGRPAFEVASVKPVTNREVLLQRGLACGFTNGGFIGFGPLRWLIACAYGIPVARDHQDIVGGPNWLDNDLFDIAANLATDDVPRVGSLNQQQIDEYRRRRLLMLQTLLADRFKLAVHRETKEAPMYALVIARRDGRLGPKLHPTAGDCAAWIADGRRGAPPGSRPGPPPAAGDLPCGRQMVNGFAIRGSAMTLARLADMLSPRVERPVQERTGLAGNFDLDLQWRPEPGKEGPLDAGLSESLPTSIFTALQEQLGLKLESTKGSADVLVIDHVEQPTPN
jgi:uncharacterized protein (TIGR03435 family)